MTEPRDSLARTDLTDLVARQKDEIGLSYEKLAARCIDPETGVQTVRYSWLHRLATGQNVIPPTVPQLRGLSAGFDTPYSRVQEAAGAQFFGIDTVWSEDEEVKALVHDYRDLDAEDQAKVRALTRSWRKLKQD